ncbi:hypothetical protein HYDPIDRAFT_40243 [Hydnomerulius pinastri MD-312]|uniref:Uncharacterized protein n=1 Tax=Hydnomerulius pinastri MD-312 TaxID=994086 RepID=A0A0C9W9N1_9AGAM|nr:hypothetical protein HYDPIDRAFT_40243 [Hydnomerulius pinastri MD-312]
MQQAASSGPTTREKIQSPAISNHFSCISSNDPLTVDSTYEIYADWVPIPNEAGFSDQWDLQSGLGGSYAQTQSLYLIPRNPSLSVDQTLTENLEREQHGYVPLGTAQLPGSLTNEPEVVMVDLDLPHPPEDHSAKAETLYRCSWGGGGQPCSSHIEGRSGPVRSHLREHGVTVKDRDVTACRWAGCDQRLRFGNLPRHIIEFHLGIRIKCSAPGCKFSTTREHTMKLHREISNGCSAASSVLMHIPEFSPASGSSVV